MKITIDCTSYLYNDNNNRISYSGYLQSNATVHAKISTEEWAQMGAFSSYLETLGKAYKMHSSLTALRNSTQLIPFSCGWTNLNSQRNKPGVGLDFTKKWTNECEQEIRSL